MTMRLFEKGEVVNIINQTYGGKFILEGQATVVAPIDPSESLYTVRLGDGLYERFIDPSAQTTQGLTKTLRRLNNR